MRAYYCDHFVLPLPAGHRFPMEKYAMLRERVSASGHIELVVPDAATDEDLLRVHEAGYVERVFSGRLTPREVRSIGFPWSAGLVERSRRSVGGTIAAGRSALEDGAAVNLAGGTHHAFRDRGEGFCVFNDVAVAVAALRADSVGGRVAVLDLDVHQGNGTAAVFREDPTVFTLSVHGASNYPFRKEVSDLDIALPDGADDDRYLAAVHDGVARALGGGAALAFYVAGADPFVGDRLGRLSVTRTGLAERDAIVYEACRATGTPVAVVMSGGYAQDVADTVSIHHGSVLAASALVRAASDLSSSGAAV